MNEQIIGIGEMGFVLFILTLITIVIVVLISQIFKSLRARASSMAEIARDEAYRKLAEESILVQRKMAEGQQTIVNDLSEMKARINAIEKILREVG
ncbi:hypothetical protein [Desulfosporosinus youngiae]|uniref:Uncharacterized protein n=1 Tax=Desulfosporosinus youngiae DSM 17734 TaxID=768710 RepID=H5XYX0_9FIRM|nr:hypothetical protein [Desulfosporosinus youngiae]EHQ91676.1 hypothetical protein DesyoDRAFT_4729 [Desulfosporosinus youngiae DSM 17734]